MVGEGTVADLDTGIQHPCRIETPLHPDEQVIEFRPEHFADVLGPHATIAMLSADRSAESLQDGLMNVMIALDHLLEILLVVHVEQRHDVGIAVSDMPEDGDRHALAAEEVLQIADELADPLRPDDHVVDKIDRLLPRIESIEGGIERFAGFPKLITLLLIVGDNDLRGKLIATTQGGDVLGLSPQIDVWAVRDQLSQQGGGGVSRNAVFCSADEIERVG